MSDPITSLLYSLGLSPNYKGFLCLSAAIDIAMQAPDQLLLVTKWLYPRVAVRQKTSWKAVERNIRTAIQVIWDRDPQRLQRLTSFPLSEKPSAAQFISILVFYLQSTSL